MNHNDACNLAHLTATERGTHVFRLEVGLFVDMNGVKRELGVPGEADLQGWTADGRALAIEVKIGAGRRTEKQIGWSESFRGVYILARFNARHDGRQTIREALASHLDSSRKYNLK
ncbi:MAG: hypothetical protein AAFY56_06365 [Pseudomonadota bacterium]